MLRALKIDSVYFDAARELGTLLGQRHIRLMNGAGNMGLMAAVADAALAGRGRGDRRDSPLYGGAGLASHRADPSSWKWKVCTNASRLMADLSDAVIALPGGCGTLEELLEIITWKQLGLYLNPIVILNIKDYFDPSAGYVAAGGRRKLHAYAARCHLACGRRHRRKPWN